MPKRERSTPAGRTPRWLWLLELLALYAVIAALFATERVMVYYGSPQAPTWAESFRLSAAPWSAWFLLTPLIVYLTRLYPFESPIRQRSLVVHAGALVAITFLQAFLNIYIGVVISVLWDNYHTTWEDMLWIPPSVILRYSLRNPLIYAIVAGITSTVDYYRKFKDREIRAAQLESQLSRARLQALQSQIHPHFLFNTLNAVTALMRRDVEGAERMLVRLADLLRRTLEGGESQEIPLRQELDLLEVRDDGPGFAIVVDGAPKEGIGLANTRERLVRHYGRDAQLVVRSERGRGVTVLFNQPFVPAAPAAQP